MAGTPLISVAPGLTMLAGMYLQFEAIDPTTGIAVSGVTVRSVAVYGRDISESSVIQETAGPFMLVPGPDSVS